MFHANNTHVGIVSCNDTFPCSVGEQALEATGGSVPVSTIITSISLVIVIVLTIIGNALVMAAVCKDRTIRQNAANLLVASLALTDLMVATLVMPLAALYDVKGLWVLGSAACDLFVYMDVLCCTSSILHLVAISLDRYWAVKCVDYVRNRPVKRIILLVAISWVVSAIISSPRLFGLKDEQELEDVQRLQRKNEAYLAAKGSEASASTIDSSLAVPYLIVNSTQYNSTGSLLNIKTLMTCTISQDLGYTIFSTVGAFYLPLTIMLIIYLNIYRAAKNRIRKKNFASKDTPSTSDNNSALTKLIAECESKPNLGNFRRAMAIASRASVVETSEDEESSYTVDCQDSQPKRSCLRSSRNEDETASVSAQSSCVSLSPVQDISKSQSNSSRILKLLPDFLSRTDRTKQKISLPLKKRNPQVNSKAGGQKASARPFRTRHPTNHKRLFKLPEDARKIINLPHQEYSSRFHEGGDRSTAECNFSLFFGTDNPAISPKTEYCPQENERCQRGDGFGFAGPRSLSSNQQNDPNLKPSKPSDHTFRKFPTPIISISYDLDTDNSSDQERSVSDCSQSHSIDQTRDLKDYVFLDLCIESTVVDISENSSLDESDERIATPKTVSLKIAPNTIYFTSAVVSDGPQSLAEKASGKLFLAESRGQTAKVPRASHHKFCSLRGCNSKRETKTAEKMSSATIRSIPKQNSKQSKCKTSRPAARPGTNQFITNLAKPSTLLLGVGYHTGVTKRHSAVASSKSMSALFGSMLDLSKLQEIQRKSSFCTPPSKSVLSSKLQSESKFNGRFFSQQLLQKSPLPSRLHFQSPKPRKTPEEKAREKREVKRERKAARTLGIITGSFVICWLPFFTLALLRPLSTTVAKTPQIIVSLAGWLGYLNSLLNPVIYTLFNPDFR